MKFGVKMFGKPTPPWISKVANAVLATLVFAGSTATLLGNVKMGTVVFAVGVVAKFVSNFFGTEEDQ